MGALTFQNEGSRKARKKEQRERMGKQNGSYPAVQAVLSVKTKHGKRKNESECKLVKFKRTDYQREEAQENATMSPQKN